MWISTSKYSTNANVIKAVFENLNEDVPDLSAVFVDVDGLLKKLGTVLSDRVCTVRHNVKKRKFGATANGRALVRLAKGGHIPGCEPASSMRFFADNATLLMERVVSMHFPANLFSMTGTNKLLKSIFRSAADPSYDSKTNQSLSDEQLVQVFLPEDKYYEALDELSVFDQGADMEEGAAVRREPRWRRKMRMELFTIFHACLGVSHFSKSANFS